MSSSERVIVHERFCGPPGTGNGGYVAGIAARYLGTRAEVTLQRPTPLATPLTLRRDGDGWLLESESERAPLVVARPVAALLPRLAAPPAPCFDDAVRARDGALADHPFPRCFVCGPARAAGDGLRILPGPIRPGSADVVASSWIPDASLCSDGEHVDAHFLWSALDCPGAIVAMGGQPRAMLLAHIAAEIAAPLRRDERCVVVGWRIDRSGRKHTSGTALYGEDGGLRGASEQLWIEPRPAAAA